MADIIEAWLMNSIGKNMKCVPSTLGRACYDGVLFVEILIAYNICSSEYANLLRKADTPRLALANLKKLCVWFKLLGISFNETFLKEIANKKGSAALRLLYELFIRLENRENLCYIDKKKMERLVTESTDHFHVEPVPEQKFKLQVIDDKQYLYKDIKQSDGLLQEFILREKAIQAKLAIERKKRLKCLSQVEEKPKLRKPKTKSKQIDMYDVKQKIEAFENDLRTPIRKKDRNNYVQCSPEAYISLLKLARRKDRADKCLKRNMEEDISKEVWEAILSEQELKFREMLTQSLLKQSDYERDMMLRVKKLRSRYKKYIENRTIMNEAAEKKRANDEFRATFRVQREDNELKMEKAKVLELHRRLLREKMKIKYEHDYRACWDILEDMIDFAMLCQDFKNENGFDPLRRKITEWKLLFMKGIRLLVHEYSQDLEDFDSLIVLDNEVTDVLVDYDFHLYNWLVGPWYIESFPELAAKTERLNVIGYIVHRLLELKYNYQLTMGTPADITSYPVQVSLGTISDQQVVEKLKKLLQLPKIAVIEVTSATNFVIHKYMETSEAKAIKALARKKSSTPKISSRPHVSSGISKGSRKDKLLPFKQRMLNRVSIVQLTNEIGVQFPSIEDIIHDQEILDESAILGKFAFNCLNKGQPLSDALKAFIITVYIKNLKDINGWVLVNYPITVEQVAILEFIFSGLQAPFSTHVIDYINDMVKYQMTEFNESDSKITIMSSSISLNSEKNLAKQSANLDVHTFFKTFSEGESSGIVPLYELVKLKKSEILPKPQPDYEIPTFTSFFSKVVMVSSDTARDEGVLINAIRPYDDEGLEEDKELTLEDFYGGLGIGVNFIYNKFDIWTLKKLARLVLNEVLDPDSEFYRKSLELFGNDAVFPSSRDKTARLRLAATSKVTIPERKSLITPESKQKDNSWGGLLQELRHSRYTLEDEIEAEEEVLEEQKGEPEDDSPVVPGHRNWEYTELPIEEKWWGPLATVWEAVEFFYLTNIKAVFGQNRGVESKLLPYRNFIRKKSEECLNLRDDRRLLTTNFQVMLNNINDELRSIENMKNELHCRTFELQCNLWSMTDSKKFLSEGILQQIMDQNWIVGHIVNKLKTYSCLIQIEMDRFVDTMQLLMDYHYLCLVNKPCDVRLSKITSLRVSMSPDEGEEEENNHNKSKLEAKKRGTSLNTISFDLQKNILYCNGIFERQDEEDPAATILKKMEEHLVNRILNVKGICDNSKSDAILIFEKTHRRSKKKPSRKGSSVRFAVGTRDSGVTENELFRNKEKLELEWIAALTDETERTLFRLELIKARAILDIQEDTSIINEAFDEFKNNITHQYHIELLNIDKVCDLFKVAIEEEVKIQPLIILENDKFYVDGAVILFPDVPPPPPTRLEELSSQFTFSIDQLTKLFYKLSYVAPLGIPERPFIHILEDMSVMGHEMGHSYLPPSWSGMTSGNVADIVWRCFGNKSIVNCKDFIIFGLDIRCPTMDEILDMKKQFKLYDQEDNELVTYAQYVTVILWFENTQGLTLNKDLYIAKTKDLLFKVFSVAEDRMNYTDFLFAFCKDSVAVEGFAKALALVEDCATVVYEKDMFLEDNQIERALEKFKIVEIILEIVLATVFREVDSVMITDYEEVEEEEYDELGEESSLLTAPSSSRKTVKSHSTPSSKGRQTAIKKKRSKDPGINIPLVEAGKEKAKEKRESPDHREVVFDVDIASESAVTMPLEEEDFGILWKSSVSYDVVIAVLMNAIGYTALAPQHIYGQLDLERHLNKIFRQKGVGFTIKLHVLLRDPFIVDMFTSYKCFQHFNLSEMVYGLFRAKEDLEKIMHEQEEI